MYVSALCMTACQTEEPQGAEGHQTLSPSTVYNFSCSLQNEGGCDSTIARKCLSPPPVPQRLFLLTVYCWNNIFILWYVKEAVKWPKMVQALVCVCRDFNKTGWNTGVELACCVRNAFWRLKVWMVNLLLSTTVKLALKWYSLLPLYFWGDGKAWPWHYKLLDRRPLCWS